MKTIKTNDGVSLAYSDEGTGKPVVFVPGYSISRHSWSMQKQAFLDQGYRVITLDRRNHGASDRPSFGQRMSRHGKDLHDFITGLELEDVLLIGNSMGASTIFAYVSLFGDDQLSGIVDIDQTPKMINDANWEYGMYSINRESAATFFDAPLPGPLYKLVDPGFLMELAKETADLPAFDLETTKPLLLDHAHADWLDILPLIDVPVLFIAGRNSPFWPCEHAAASAALCKNGQAVVIEDCGHVVNWEQPAICNEKLLEFAKSIY
ncbi:alpha/beta fold hydrolase [Neobacillus muris]|uniref:alpha/beta fold hydrolase n=1 Tax=Neobacillus muris TaxID=2941334 RepID=UPI00204094F1|nr:alpha/beta hydrolase [Neobacillus muris]